MNELILIVEDEEDIAEILRYNLQKAGYRTVAASDGEQAVRIVRHGNPDLVLLDLMLPEMDGWEVCRVLRGSEQAAGTPVVIVTAMATEDARVLSLRAGAGDFITKPFSAQALLLKVRKILDEKHALRTLGRAHADLVQSLRRLVHELKNSVAVISGYASLAESKCGGDPAIRRIALAAERMDRVLTDTQLMTAVESGGPLMPTEDVEIGPLLGDVVASLEPAARERNVSVQLIGGAAAALPGNRTYLREVLFHLLANAIRYNRPGGRVWLRVEEREQELDISVKDEGRGIGKDQCGRIFEKFYRCPGSTDVPGAGLGLYVAKLLTNSLGGRIAVASDSGNGAAFTVTFPRRQAQEHCASGAGEQTPLASGEAQ